MSTYELYLTDDAGRRIALLNKLDAFFSYSRTTRGLGTIQFGCPFEAYRKLVPDIFRVDWRIDVWRSPGKGFPSRRDASYLLRKHTIYQREDGMLMIELNGRSPLDILRRMIVAVADQDVGFVPTAARYEKNDYADDMMKEIVRENFTPDFGPVPFTNSGGASVATGEWTVDPDQSLGPVVKEVFYSENVLDVLKKIKAATFSLNLLAPSTNRRIYFDVVEGPGLAGGFGYIFRTYAGLRGIDRTGHGLIFSLANGNLQKPAYYEEYYDQVAAVDVCQNHVFGGVAAFAVDLTAKNLSRWNYVRLERTGSTINNGADYDENLAEANRVLNENRASKSLNADFLNTPGGPTQPRSLYGVDWDMGDLVRAEFAGKSLDVEIKVVWVSVNDKGVESVTGYSEIGE